MTTARKRVAGPDEGPRTFLGVRQSARDMVWLDRLDATGLNLAAAISQRHGLPDLLGRVLAARGATLDNVPVLLNPTVKALMPDPSSVNDMDKGARRIADAIRGGEPIAIFGDYDVDGACASALLKRFLAHHGRDARIYIPDRLFEGYGPNATAIAGLVKDGAKLIITVDCGTTSHEALAAAKGTGTDVLIIDHHQAAEALPDVHGVINPNRQDDLSGLGHLCAAGLVFMVLVAVTRVLRSDGYYGAGKAPPDLLQWLDMVALATVCDVVPLEGLNRAYVAKGLQVLHGRNNVGLRALGDAAGLHQAPTPYHLGFVLGPRINAGGRIGDAGLGAKLLSTDDESEAARIAVLLDKLNRERKAMETEMLEAALARAGEEVERDPELPIVIAGSKDWHKGLVGLVASRLTDRFQRPSLVIAWTGDSEGTGSLRSIAGVDIGGAVRAAVEEGLLVKGGGHSMAAGLTVKEERLAALTRFFHTRLGRSVGRARGEAGLKVDGALTPRGVTAELIELLERAGPFGQGNPTPRFVFPAHRIKALKIMGEAHIRCTIEAGDASKLEAVAFRSVGTPLGNALTEAASGMPVHLAGHLRRDTWNGREKIELMIEDVADPRRQG